MNWLSQISRIVVAVVMLSVLPLFDVACLLAQVEDDLSEVAQPSDSVTAEGIERMILDGATPRGGLRGRLERQLIEKIRELATAVSLSESVQRKMKLAGREDVRRFFDELDNQVLAARKLTREGATHRDVHRHLHQAMKPLRIHYQNGLFEESSLFHKTLWANLDAEQRRRLTEYLNRERQEEFENQFDRVFNAWPIFPMSDDQRETVKKFLSQEIPPPLHINSHVSDYVLFQLANLPEEKVRPLFKLIQWDDFSDLLERAKSYEEELIEHGLLSTKSTVENAEDIE